MKLRDIASIAVAFWAAGSGCEGSASPQGWRLDGGEPFVELGTGFDTFEPLSEPEPTLEIEMGFQGGWHVVLASRIGGVWAEGLVLRYELVEEDGGGDLGRPIERTVRAERLVEDGDAWVHLADLIVLDVTDPQQAAGRAARARVALELPNGEVLRDARTVRLVDEE